MIMKRNIKTFLSARPLCCYLIAAITLALSLVSCNDEWKDEQYEQYVSFRAPLNDQGVTPIYVRGRTPMALLSSDRDSQTTSCPSS